MQNFWPSSGLAGLARDARGWLRPNDAYLRRLLERPELAVLPESCAAERALHAALHSDPRQPMNAANTALLAALQDADVRTNYQFFLRLRDGLLAAGTLEAYYLALLRRPVELPPLLLEGMVQTIVHGLLVADAADTAAAPTDAVQARAAELLFRSQRIALHQGRLLAADEEALATTAATKQPASALEVLGADTEARYWQEAAQSTPCSLALDLAHEVQHTLSHGLTMLRSRCALTALAQLLERWVAHFLDVVVHIQPVRHIDDPAWRWHIGLDAASSQLLNALYQGQPVEPAQQQQWISLFRLDFANASDMRSDLAGKPVYLGLAMDAGQKLRLKPQNLLLNLPLAQH